MIEAQIKKIETLKVETKTVGKAAVQNYIENFEKIELYDLFASCWASWNTQSMLEHLRKVYPNLYISALEKERVVPIGGRPDLQTIGEVQNDAPNAEADEAMGDGTIVRINPQALVLCNFVMASISSFNE